ncbi:hypothetical protein MMPV_000038 [Pyropia vietnamensis]
MTTNRQARNPEATLPSLLRDELAVSARPAPLPLSHAAARKAVRKARRARGPGAAAAVATAAAVAAGKGGRRAAARKVAGGRALGVPRAAGRVGGRAGSTRVATVLQTPAAAAAAAAEGAGSSGGSVAKPTDAAARRTAKKREKRRRKAAEAAAATAAILNVGGPRTQPVALPDSVAAFGDAAAGPDGVTGEPVEDPDAELIRTLERKLAGGRKRGGRKVKKRPAAAHSGDDGGGEGADAAVPAFDYASEFAEDPDLLALLRACEPPAKRQRVAESGAVVEEYEVSEEEAEAKGAAEDENEESEEEAEAKGAAEDEYEVSEEEEESDGETLEEYGDSEEEEEVEGAASVEDKQSAEKEKARAMYVAPNLRGSAASGGASAATARLTRRIRALLNRLTTGNAPGIAADLAGVVASGGVGGAGTSTATVAVSRSETVGAFVNALLDATADGGGGSPYVAALAAVAVHVSRSVDAAVGARLAAGVVGRLQAARGAPAGAPGGVAAAAAASVTTSGDRRGALAYATLLGWLYRRGAVAGGLLLGAATTVGARLVGADVDVLLALLRVAGHALRAEDPVAVRDLLVGVKARAEEVSAAAAARPAAGSHGSGSDTDGDGGASPDEATSSDQQRLAIMLSLVYDVANNRGTRGRGGSAASVAEDAREWRWVGAGVAGATPAPLDVGWAELLDPTVTRGRWWDAAAMARRRVDAVMRPAGRQGKGDGGDAAATAKDAAGGGGASVDDSGGGGGNGGVGGGSGGGGGTAAASLLTGVAAGAPPLAALAAGQRLNTAARRRLFTEIMASTGVDEAVTRLAALGALCATTAGAARHSRAIDADAARVLLHCAGAEAAENPFYAALAVRLATASAHAGRAFTYALWDEWARLDPPAAPAGADTVALAEAAPMAVRRSRNLAGVAAALLASRAVTLRVLLRGARDWVLPTPREAFHFRCLLSRLLGGGHDDGGDAGTGGGDRWATAVAPALAELAADPRRGDLPAGLAVFLSTHLVGVTDGVRPEVRARAREAVAVLEAAEEGREDEE